MVFDRTDIAAHVSAAFISDAIIRPADDQKAAWVLESARVDGYSKPITHARRTCDAALADVAAVEMKKVTVLMS